MTKNIFTCSFCKRNQKEVKKLIAGPNVYICDFCTNTCAEILHNDEKTSEINIINKEIISPEEIFQQLEEVVSGQEEAKKELSIAAYLHKLRMQEYILKKNLNPNLNPILDLKKYNILMIGPTGCGKTLIMTTLAKILDISYIVVDANSFTKVGYVGEDIESIINKLFLQNFFKNQNLEEAIIKTMFSIVFIDEIDKKAAQTSSHEDVAGKGVQENALKLIEGSDVQVYLNGKQNNLSQEPILINTSNIFFVVGGAFQGLEKIIKNRIKQNFLSLQTPINNITKNHESLEEIYKFFIRDDLITYGMIPEFTGRFSSIVFLNSLKKSQLVEILNKKKNNLIDEYKKIFQLHNTELKIDDNFYDAIAEKALKENIGARGLRSILHNLFSEILFKIPKIYIENKNKSFYILLNENHIKNNSSLEINSL